jgi:hypothetical protein
VPLARRGGGRTFRAWVDSPQPLMGKMLQEVLEGRDRTSPARMDGSGAFIKTGCLPGGEGMVDALGLGLLICGWR